MAVAVSFVPSASGLSGVRVNAPESSATTFPTTLPAPSVTVTVEPGSAVPVTVLPSVEASTGASGATASTVTVFDGPETLPEPSVAVAVTFVPSASGLEGVRVNVPSSPARVVPTIEPAPSVTVTVVPGTAVPVTVLPSVGASTGASGATASTVTVFDGPETLPDPSVAVAVTVVPSASGLDGVIVKVPLSAATVVPTTLPAPSVTVTVAPGSAVPETVVPLDGARIGASGATASTVTVFDGPETLPEPSVAVAVTVVPSASGLEGVKVKCPEPSATAVPTSAPEPSVRVTVEPGSAVPVTVLPSVAASTGASGATASTVTVFDGAEV